MYYIYIYIYIHSCCCVLWQLSQSVEFDYILLHFLTLNEHLLLHIAYIHSIISYGIIFWGNQPYSDKIFKIQKRVIRIITSSRPRDLCRELFKNLEILPLYSQYIYSISIYVVKNKHLFHTNNQIHSIHTRFKTNLHPPRANLTKFQKGVHYLAVNIFNNLCMKSKT